LLETQDHPLAWRPEDEFEDRTVLAGFATREKWQQAHADGMIPALDADLIQLSGDVPAFIRHMSTGLMLIEEFAGTC